MRMSFQHFTADRGGHVQNVEVSMLTADLRMEYHLQKHVAQLVVHMVGIVFPDGLDVLVAFLQKIRQQAFVGLLPIPWAAFRRTKPGHDPHQIVHIVSAALFHRDCRNIYGGQMVIGRLTVHLHQRDFLCLQASVFLPAGDQRDGQFVRQKLHQLQLAVACAFPGIQFAKQQRFIRQQTALFQLAGRHDAHMTALPFDQRQAAVRQADPRHDLQLQLPGPEPLQCEYRAVKGRVADHVTQIPILQPAEQRHCRRLMKSVKVLALLVKAVQRIEAEPLLRQKSRNGTAARPKHKLLRAAKSRLAAAGQILCAPRPQRNNVQNRHGIIPLSFPCEAEAQGRSFVQRPSA